MDSMKAVVAVGTSAVSSVGAMSTVPAASHDDLLKTIIATVVSVVVHILFSWLKKKKLVDNSSNSSGSSIN